MFIGHHAAGFLGKRFAPRVSLGTLFAAAMLLVNSYPRYDQKLAVAIAICGVGALCYITLLAAVPLSRLIGDRGRTVFTKVMSLLLGAIGIQFIINGLKPVLTEIIRSS